MQPNEPSFFEKANHWIKTSVTLRLFTIGILVLLMLIPINMITSLIREREYRQEEAIREVSSKWGEAQTITGPVLTVPYKVYSSRKYAHFLPADLRINGEINPEKRYRGIYEVIVYNGVLQMEGRFDQPSFAEWKIAAEDILWDEAFIQMGISDLKGLKENVDVNWNGTPHALNPGIETQDVIQNGLSARVPVIQDSAATGYSFKTTIDLNGSSTLDFTPVGKSTHVTLKSTWPDPNFMGSSLPDKRDITKDGFAAEWKVLHLNRPYPQQFRGTVQGIYESTFGVNLMVTVDEYQKSMRSAKYAVLFIILTFMMFFFAQILNKVRIHPIQYLLVGFALCIFYTLLIALSEHIPFAFSYLIASIAIIGLITFYVHSIFIHRRITVIISLVLISLYVFIFSIIQLEDYALLMGSIGLFLVLAIAMWLSRKIDWYRLQDSRSTSVKDQNP